VPAPWRSLHRADDARGQGQGSRKRPVPEAEKAEPMRGRENFISPAHPTAQGRPPSTQSAPLSVFYGELGSRRSRASGNRDGTGKRSGADSASITSSDRIQFLTLVTPWPCPRMTTRFQSRHEHQPDYKVTAPPSCPINPDHLTY